MNGIIQKGSIKFLSIYLRIFETYLRFTFLKNKYSEFLIRFQLQVT